MVGYTRQSAATIIPGAVITAEDINAEYNQLASAFDATTGHVHDGSPGGGPKVPLTTGVSGTLPITSGGTGTTTASLALTALGGQPLNAALTSIAAAVTVSDRILYTTASNAYAVATLTAFARTILDDSNAISARATLGLTLPIPVASGGTGSADALTARTALGVGIGTDIQAYDVDTLKSDVTANLTVGYRTTPFPAGVKSTGTFTPTEASGQIQEVTNGGAHTLAPPTNPTVLTLLYTNNATAGAITTSGFSYVDGDTITLTNGHRFIFSIVKFTTTSTLTIKALQ